MRISDWSSDVCSSDLHEHALGGQRVGVGLGVGHLDEEAVVAYRGDDGAGDHGLAEPWRTRAGALDGVHRDQVEVVAEDRARSSEERRVGKESECTCSSRWSPVN